MTARIVQGAEPVLQITMHEFGDLPIFLNVGADQIVVSVLLWPVDEQADRAAFNEFLLKAQKLVPLSNFGITTVGGRDYYELFGGVGLQDHPADRADRASRARRQRHPRGVRNARELLGRRLIIERDEHVDL